MNINLKPLEVWFVTGSQHLYGPETLKAVAAHASDSPENAQRELGIVKPGENNFKKVVEEFYGKV